MRNKANRLTKKPGPIVSVRADSDFTYLLAALTGKDGTFQSQSEAIYQGLYEMGNRMGIKTPLGDQYETLSNTSSTEGQEKIYYNDDDDDDCALFGVEEISPHIIDGLVYIRNASPLLTEEDLEMLGKRGS